MRQRDYELFEKQSSIQEHKYAKVLTQIWSGYVLSTSLQNIPIHNHGSHWMESNSDTKKTAWSKDFISTLMISNFVMFRAISSLGRLVSKTVVSFRWQRKCACS
mmetsp:Transcript_64697/g.173437  ORF Transcript_64697/g.173437 Transcript_64697/m.173437 type:complete len:104 (+) Transcript_64697:105-416(+)